MHRGEGRCPAAKTVRGVVDQVTSSLTAGELVSGEWHHLESLQMRVRAPGCLYFHGCYFIAGRYANAEWFVACHVQVTGRAQSQCVQFGFATCRGLLYTRSKFGELCARLGHIARGVECAGLRGCIWGSGYAHDWAYDAKNSQANPYCVSWTTDVV